MAAPRPPPATHALLSSAQTTMPSFSNDVPYQPAATKAANNRSFDSQHGKSQEKTSVGNTFLWTNWPNGDSNRLDAPHSDRQLYTELKNGSAYSVNASRTSVNSPARDPPHSKDGDVPPPSNGPARELRDGGKSSATLDKDIGRESFDTGFALGSATASNSRDHVNGTPLSPRPSTGKPIINGEYPRPSVDELASADSAGHVSVPRLSTSQPEEAGRLSPESGRLSPGARSSVHRYSSPPTPSGVDGANAQELTDPGLRHRHTLQVPRSSSTRRNSRDQSEDAFSTGRLSPTSGIRRTSLSLARRATRSIQSDIHPDEGVPDEEATRWTEAIKHRRASKRRRRDEDDDDRVIVGTKVDHNHVNWVTAYNMLTGIRFTVSRINAKMDRELTPADFQAKHKFSFDM